MESLLQEILVASEALHPRKHDQFIGYGTAGFRTRADYLDHIMFRMGVVSVLRSKAKNGQCIGVMITASHNPEEDNGIKLVDPMGEMLEGSWEKYATTIANASQSSLATAISSIISEQKIDINVPSKVFFAKDTRPSSESLAKSLQDGIETMKSEYVDYGLLTTPQLHYMVRCYNTNGSYGEATEKGYYNKMANAFCKFRGEIPDKKSYKAHVVVDGANGVGADKVKQFAQYAGNKLNITIVNDGSSGKLNHMCGADYVKVQQKAPGGMSLEHGSRYCSFDGDADRIVYYYADSSGTFHLLDGDKIATLVATLLMELLQQSGLQLELGIVQTAYANGSSTDYINNKLKVPVACTPTGVKYLHHRAEQYDIGVYFEANGHGTIVFNQKAETSISQGCSDDTLTASQKEASQKLSMIKDIINQTVGDALSDMLLVESVLHYKDWDASSWDKSYTDLANRQLKVKVADRTVVQTIDAERQVSSPVGLQPEIDKLMKQFPHGRSFVRPSGTEDVVRVYAESDTQEHADDLATQVAAKVYSLAGGVGPLP